MILIDRPLCNGNGADQHETLGRRACLALRSIRVFRILQPIRGIVGDVLPDGIQFSVVADDVLVIISLPHGLTGSLSHLIDAAGRDRFEIPNDGAEFPPIEIVVCQPASRL
jgi:hypothetical protein